MGQGVRGGGKVTGHMAANSFKPYLKLPDSTRERGEAFRRRIMSRVEREGLTLQLKVFPSHLYTYSSINVSCARPLSVRHSSPNKQNRSSCRLCAPPSSLPQPYRADRKDGIPKMQLSDRSTMQRGYSGVAIETNMVPFMWLPLYNIIS